MGFSFAKDFLLIPFEHFKREKSAQKSAQLSQKLRKPLRNAAKGVCQMANIRENVKCGKIVSYRFTVCLERDVNQKQIRRYYTWAVPQGLSVSKARKAAERAADKWEHEVREEYDKQKTMGLSYVIPVEKRQDSFTTFVNEVWFPLRICNGNDKQSTIAFYRNMKKEIVNYFDGELLQEINFIQIQRFLVYLTKEYRTQRGKPLAPKTIRHYYNVLKLIFDYAEMQNMIAVNPMLKVETPKKDKKQVDALSEEESKLFFQRLSDSPLDFQCLLYLLITTGLRRGECLGLKWKDIDEKANTVKIERSAIYTPETGTIITTPKTANGTRTIPLIRSAVELLQKLKAQTQMQNKTANLQEAFIFPSNSDDICKACIENSDKCLLAGKAPTRK